jgi:hypothetical protein
MSETDTAMTREQAHGRATGALFFVGFGSVWIATGLAQMHHASAVVLVPLALISILLLIAVSQAMRRSRSLPAAELSAEEQVRTDRMFTAVNIIQWVSIATAVAVLGLLHMPEYIVAAIAIIVGLHLFPLAGSFRNRQHYITGALLLLWPLGCLALLPRARVSGVCGLGVGLVLLVSAAVTLARTFARLRVEHLHDAVARG